MNEEQKIQLTNELTELMIYYINKQMKEPDSEELNTGAVYDSIYYILDKE